MVARALQQGSQRMGIFNGKIKSVVAHHPGMSPVYPEKQGGSRRGTYGRALALILAALVVASLAPAAERFGVRRHADVHLADTVAM